MNKSLALHIESLIFASEKPITIEDITNVVEETMEMILDPGQVEEAIQLLTEKYSSEDFSMEIIEISGGYAFMTKGAFHYTISNYLKQTTTKKLSKAALETLSIIAYKQPVSKTEIESIRGVNCDYAIQKLLEKELIEIRGRSESLGKPLLYGTSEKFFDYFGLRGVQDLPKLKDFEMPENSIGVPSPEEVDTPVIVDGETVQLDTHEIELESIELMNTEEENPTTGLTDNENENITDQEGVEEE